MLPVVLREVHFLAKQKQIVQILQLAGEAGFVIQEAFFVALHTYPRFRNHRQESVFTGRSLA